MRSPSGDAHLNRDETAVKMGHAVCGAWYRALVGVGRIMVF